MKRLGQHFLKNKSVAKKIVAALELAPGDIVVEIGPGHGELTLEMKNEKLKIKNLRIVAVEKDKQLADELRWKFAENKNIEIVDGDALKILPRLIHDSRSTLHASRFTIVGNIPYYITGHLLRVIGELEARPALCVFMVQAEVAERIAAKPPKTNRLSASVQFWAEPKIIARVPRSDFSPPPDVDSAIVKLEAWSVKRETPEKEYYAAVRALFQQPRKTILNNLAAASDEPRETLAERLMNIGILPENRPQDLSVEDIIRIARFLAS